MSRIAWQSVAVFEDDICGEAYERLISTVALFAESFGFKYPWALDKRAHARAIMRSLEPWLKHGDRRPPRRGERVLTNVYGVTPESLVILRSVAECLFDWNVPALPKDLFFVAADNRRLLDLCQHGDRFDAVWELRLGFEEWELLWNRSSVMTSWYEFATDPKRRRGVGAR